MSPQLRLLVFVVVFIIFFTYGFGQAPPPKKCSKGVGAGTFKEQCEAADAERVPGVGAVPSTAAGLMTQTQCKIGRPIECPVCQCFIDYMLDMLLKNFGTTIDRTMIRDMQSAFKCAKFGDAPFSDICKDMTGPYREVLINGIMAEAPPYVICANMGYCGQGYAAFLELPTDALEPTDLFNFLQVQVDQFDPIRHALFSRYELLRRQTHSNHRAPASTIKAFDDLLDHLLPGPSTSSTTDDALEETNGASEQENCNEITVANFLGLDEEVVTTFLATMGPEEEAALMASAAASSKEVVKYQNRLKVLKDQTDKAGTEIKRKLNELQENLEDNLVCPACKCLVYFTQDETEKHFQRPICDLMGTLTTPVADVAKTISQFVTMLCEDLTAQPFSKICKGKIQQFIDPIGMDVLNGAKPQAVCSRIGYCPAPQADSDQELGKADVGPLMKADIGLSSSPLNRTPGPTGGDGGPGASGTDHSRSKAETVFEDKKAQAGSTIQAELDQFGNK